MKKTILLTVAVLIMTILTNTARSQIASGNTFTIEKAVVSNGGGASNSATFSIDGTGGQSAAGQTAGGIYQIQGGFWSANLAPTAAGVSISGRVLSADGRGLRNAFVYLTDNTGRTRTTRTGTFGYYRFDGIEAGQVAVIGVNSKLYQFEPRVLVVNDSLSDVNLMPISSAENRNR